MDSAQRSEAVFGCFDGLISVIGFVFALLVHKASRGAIAVGATGGAIAAAVSMGTAEYEKNEGRWHEKVRLTMTMALATAIGSALPAWPFFIFSKPIALVVGGIEALAVAGWIGYEKSRGVSGYVKAYVTLLLASGATLGIVSLIPQSAG